MFGVIICAIITLKVIFWWSTSKHIDRIFLSNMGSSPTHKVKMVLVSRAWGSIILVMLILRSKMGNSRIIDPQGCMCMRTHEAERSSAHVCVCACTCKSWVQSPRQAQGHMHACMHVGAHYKKVHVCTCTHTWAHVLMHMRLRIMHGHMCSRVCVHVAHTHFLVMCLLGLCQNADHPDS